MAINVSMEIVFNGLRLLETILSKDGERFLACLLRSSLTMLGPAGQKIRFVLL